MPRNVEEQIVELATQKFYKYGFSKVSMDSLVEELRISKSTLYKYFPSKEALVQAVIRRYTSTIDRKFEDLMADESIDVFDKMISFTRFYGHMLTQVTDEFIREIELLTPQLWEQEVDLRVSRFTCYLEKIFDMGVESGLFRPDLNKDIVIFLYIKTTEFVYTKQLEKFNLRRKEAFAAISELFLQGVLTDLGRERLSERKRLQETGIG